MSAENGLVVQNRGSLYLVKTREGTTYWCKLKGSFKLFGIRTTNPVAVGDWVLFEMPHPESDTSSDEEAVGWITKISPRRNYMIRRASNLSKQAHILGANLDRSLLIVTVNFPVTSTTFIDRYLATAEAYQVETALVFNKVDRYHPAEQKMLQEWTKLYEGIGYRCFSISAKHQEIPQELKEYISTGVTLVSGHSGVGKSTFVNALVPNASLKTAEISEAHNVGVHTTSFSEMIPYGDGGTAYLIDTPGIKGFGTIEFEREEVGHYFPEIFAQSKECFFGNCTHIHEPKCAVLSAIKDGIIAESRYKSYLSILNDEDDSKYRL